MKRMRKMLSLMGAVTAVYIPIAATYAEVNQVGVWCFIPFFICP